MSLKGLLALRRQLGLVGRGGLGFQHLDDTIDQTEHSQQQDPGNLATADLADLKTHFGPGKTCFSTQSRSVVKVP